MLYLFLLFYFSNYLFSDLVYKHVDVGRAKYRQERILSWYCTFPITEDWNFQAPNWLSAASKIPLYFFSLVLASMNSFFSLWRIFGPGETKALRSQMYFVITPRLPDREESCMISESEINVWLSLILLLKRIQYSALDANSAFETKHAMWEMLLSSLDSRRRWGWLSD